MRRALKGWGMASKTLMNVRKNGQGKPGHKKPVLFPKIVFLYDEKLHGPGCELEDVFEAGIECSSRSMYPDWLSMSGDAHRHALRRADELLLALREIL